MDVTFKELLSFLLCHSGKFIVQGEFMIAKYVSGKRQMKVAVRHQHKYSDGLMNLQKAINHVEAIKDISSIECYNSDLDGGVSTSDED